MGEGELKQDIATFFKDNAILIAIIFAAIILITLATFIIIYSKKKTSKSVNKVTKNEFIEALGGEENILEKTATRSRLTLKLSDISKLDEDKIKTLGVSNIIKMSNKVTLVLEDNAEKILEKIK